MHDIATRNLIPHASVGDVVVSRSGTATAAWEVSVDWGEVRTMDDPAAPGDPQSPAGPPDPQHRQLLHSYGGEDVLEIDAAGTQTLLWLSDERGTSGGPSPFSEYYDVVLGGRSPGGGWSNSPAVVGAGYVHHAQLAVNASGAAVVAWDQYEGRKSHVYAAFREGAAARWSSAERVEPDGAILSDVGIDDAGRVLLLYSSRGAGVKAIRRDVAGQWGKSQHVAGGGTVAVAADGVAVVAYSRDNPSGPRLFTVRMSPAGIWDAPVRQPDGDAGYRQRAVEMDAKGHALYAWWDGTDLMVRWSRPNGVWRRPCVLAAGVTRPHWLHSDAQLAVNRRGDALVVWGAKKGVPPRVAQLWARYKPAGQGWTKPVKLTRAAGPPATYTIALGDRGHAAITWTPRNGRQVHIVRTSPKH